MKFKFASGEETISKMKYVGGCVHVGDGRCISGIHTEGGEPWDIHPQTSDLPLPPKLLKKFLKLVARFQFCSLFIT